MPGTNNEAITLQQRLAFGWRLRQLRESKGMTQTALAAAAGLNRSFYVQVEHGNHSISVDRVFALARVLGVNMSELFTGLPVKADEEHA